MIIYLWNRWMNQRKTLNNGDREWKEKPSQEGKILVPEIGRWWSSEEETCYMNGIITIIFVPKGLMASVWDVPPIVSVPNSMSVIKGRRAGCRNYDYLPNFSGISDCCCFLGFLCVFILFSAGFLCWYRNELFSIQPKWWQFWNRFGCCCVSFRNYSDLFGNNEEGIMQASIFRCCFNYLMNSG